MRNNKKRKRKLFCEINPVCYAVSLQKEIYMRHLKNWLGGEKFSHEIKTDPLPHLISSQSSPMIKRGNGINLLHQKNKAANIMLSCSKIHGMLIGPNETFSFWKIVGKTSKKNGYQEGRILHQNKLIAGLGGGLCNLANTLHLLVLHSPLEVTEFHTHSDALAPDNGERIPLSAGTSVYYNHIDYKFKNTTSQKFQLLAWCTGDVLYAQLRSDGEIPLCYELTEEDHHFRKEGSTYYSCSKIYRNVMDKETKIIIAKELVLDNHSQVMYDYDLIPSALIQEAKVEML